MTNPAPQTITPERQQAAAQVGQVFNSVHEYLSTLMHANADGQKLTSQPMEFARKAAEEASFWAIKHVLQFGVPAAPKPAAAGTATTSEPKGQPGSSSAAPDAPTGADALPPTTPTEAV
jgi:hypothetical protein